MSCSALKRKYRDQLRAPRARRRVPPPARHPEVIARRQASRPGHFMPASLLDSQFATLEPLAPDEHGRRRRRRPERRRDRPGLRRPASTQPTQTADEQEHHVPRRPRRRTDSSNPSPPAGSWSLAALRRPSRLIVVLITWVKVHPFLALILGGAHRRHRRRAEHQRRHRQLLHRLRYDGRGRRRADRARRHVRQAARRLRRRRPDRRHDRRHVLAAGCCRGRWPASARSSVCRCSSRSASCC